MSSGVFKSCRALQAAAKATGTRKSSANPVAAKKPTTTTAAAAAKPKPKSKPRSSSSSSEPRKPAGILKVSPVSPALHQFLGVPQAARTDALKQIWDYIKLHNLQNPADKREICCDAKLKTIFEGKDKVGMFEVGKLLSLHFVKTN